MKFFKIINSGSIATLLNDASLLVFSENGNKFIAPDWYAKELYPLLEVISQNDYEDELNIILHETLDGEKEGFEEIDLDNLQLPPLYHGTDRKVLRMTDEQRYTHKACCKHVVDFIYPIFLKLFRNNGNWDISKLGLGMKLESCVIDALGCLDSRTNRNENFQYPDNVLYLHSYRGCADSYAARSFAGGEIGYIAYFLCQAVINMSVSEFHLDEETENAMQKVLAFGNEGKYPVVITLNNLDFKFLRNENGSIITDLNFEGKSYRYLKPIIFES